MKNNKESKGILSGILYGLIPHIGCIAFIVFTILGVTAAASIFKPLLLKSYFFYLLIVLSLIFATISAILYLKRNDILSFLGIKRKWKYLSILYGTTIFINLILFLVIFPYLTNAITVQKIESSGDSKLTLQVEIPCSGHAPLITQELNQINGINNIKFTSPNIFEVNYDPARTSKEKILSLEIFKEYKAKII